MTNFFIYIAGLDRRWVFVGVLIAVTVPFFWGMGLAIDPSPKTRQAWQAVEDLAGTEKPLLLSLDYGPETMAELHPIANAVLDQCFHRDIPIILVTYQVTGVGLAEEAIFSAADRYEEKTGVKKVYGKDFVFMGYKPYAFAVIVDMGEDFSKPYPTDFENTPKDELPIIRNVNTFKDIGLCMDIAGNSLPATWIAYAVGRYDAKFTMGVTAVMAADFYPYVQAGQSEGIIGGMRGAAEYEVLNAEAGYAEDLGAAGRGMDSQSWAHVFIILLIILGNIGFFLTRKRQG